MQTEPQEATPLFAAVKERKPLVACVVLLAVGLGVAYTLFAPAVWEAKATIIFPVRQPSALGLSGDDTGSIASALGGPTPVRVYTGILESAHTLDFVAKATGLRSKEVETMSTVLDQAMQNTITVSARSKDPSLAMNVVSLRLQALRDINSSLNMPLAQNDVEVLQSKIAQEQASVSDCESKLLDFQQHAVTAPTLTPSGNGKQSSLIATPTNWVATLRELEIQYAKVDSQIRQAQDWSDKVAADGGELPTPFPGTEKWRGTLADLEYDLRTAQLSFSPTAPEIKMIEEKIRIAKAQLQGELEKYAKATHEGLIDPQFSDAQKLPGLMADRVALEAQITAVARLAALAPEEAGELTRLMRELGTHTVILQQLQEQAQVASIQQARDPNRWEVLDAPHLGDEPVNKSILRNTALSLALGLFAAVSLASALGRPRKKRGGKERIELDEAA